MDAFKEKCERGLEEMHANNLAKARSLFEEALAIRPKSPYALTYKAVCDFESGAIAEGLAGAKLAVEFRGQETNPCYFYGRMLARSGNPEEALKYLKRAADEEPSHVPFLLELGECHLKLGQRREAATLAAKASSLDPKSEHAWNLADRASDPSNFGTISEVIRIGHYQARRRNGMGRRDEGGVRAGNGADIDSILHLLESDPRDKDGWALFREAVGPFPVLRTLFWVRYWVRSIPLGRVLCLCAVAIGGCVIRPGASEIQRGVGYSMSGLGALLFMSDSLFMFLHFDRKRGRNFGIVYNAVCDLSISTIILAAVQHSLPWLLAGLGGVTPAIVRFTIMLRAARASRTEKV